MNLDDQVKAIRSTISLLDTGKPVVCYVGHRSVEEALKLKKIVLIVSYENAFNCSGTFCFNTIAGSYRYAVPVPLAEIAGFSEMQAEIDRLKIQLEQIDTVRSGLPCDHVWGTSGYSPALDAPVAAVCMKCGADGQSVRNGWIGCNPKMEKNQ